MQVKGFTMIQCLIALAIASITSLFTSVMVRPIHLGSSHIFYGKALYTQVLSIFDQSYQNMEVLKDVILMNYFIIHREQLIKHRLFIVGIES